MAVAEVHLPWLTTSFIEAKTATAASLVVGFLFFLLFHFKALVEKKTFRPLQYVSNRLEAWKYLFYGTVIIQEKFEKSNGEAFEVFAPDNRYVFVSSPKHIKELDSAPDTVLSLQAASKQMLQPAHTMHGFNWFDRRGTEGVGFVRALRTLLTNNLPQILPDLSVISRARFAELHAQHPIVDVKNEQFMVSALAYIEETLVGAEAVRLLPKFMVPFVGNFLTWKLKSHEVIFGTLVPVAEQRCLERDLKNLGQQVPYHADCIQWIMETSPRQSPWTPKRIVHELMAIWFGSVHALSTTITFAIHDLCLHPGYVEPLRRELQCGYADFERTATGLPLLDSFIKESARLTPVEAQSTRRSALQPFSLSDGTRLEVGDWACTPVRAIMTNPTFYPTPLDFHGFRFAPPDVVAALDAAFKVPQEKSTRLVDVDSTFHVWGTGRMACPGRYYAAAVIKVILGQTILNYDFELVDRDAPRWFTWLQDSHSKNALNWKHFAAEFAALKARSPVSTNHKECQKQPVFFSLGRVEEVDTFIIAATTSGNKAVAPRAKRNGFDGSTVDPSVFLGAC
ncbi:hypothetical protein G7Y89_g4888 [Cudoniella acicularis]|uniref:Cytochrome P450 n=1 Tax=Cudoniella acicularis TaxID=354080 RepID=A0A8H4RQL4_9HELO|nr:hypothetical protein G7Y89_g4888 [Cudoniella acicularis]